MRLTYHAKITRRDTALGELAMKLSLVLAIGVLCAGALAAVAIKIAIAPDDDQALLQADREVFRSGTSSIKLNDNLLDENFTWTDSSGNTRNKSDIMQDLRSGKGLPMEAGQASGGGKIIISTISTHADGRLGLVQTNSG